MSISYYLLYKEKKNYKLKNKQKKNIKVIIFNSYDSYIIDNNINIIKKNIFDYLYNLEQYNSYVKKVLNCIKNNHLWNMSIIKEKSPYKLSSFDEIVKIFSISEEIKKNKDYKLYFEDFPEHIEKIFYKILNHRENKIKFTFNFLFYKYVKNFYKISINLIKSLIFISIYLKRNYFLFNFKKKIKLNKNTVILVSYFTHLKNYKNKNNVFYSNQWGDLENKLKNININVLYLHLYEKSSSSYNERQIKNFLKNNNSHYFFQNYLSVFDISIIILNFLKIYTKFFWNNLFYNTGEIYNNDPLFNLIDKEFINSISGPTLFENLVYEKVFNNFFKINNKKLPIIYLMENQPWEYSLLRNAQKFKNIKTIGYPHTTINPWHLNYSFNENFNKLPDFVYSSGKLNFDKLSSQIELRNKIKKVESLRYSQLILQNTESRINKNKILILGDYIDNNNKLFFNIKFYKMNEINGYSFCFKPHPSKAMQIKDNNKIPIIYDDIKDIINNYDIFICCNSTASSAELYQNNKIVLIYIPKNKVNLSPFLQTTNIENVYFFSDINELIQILKSIDISKIKHIKNNLFNINSKLQKWIYEIQKII